MSSRGTLSKALNSLVAAVALWAAVGTACTVFAATGATDRPEVTESPEETARRIGALITQLGDEKYFVRQQAHEQLAKLGAEAYDALVVAQENDDLEIRERARNLVQLIRIELVEQSDSPEVKEKLSDYESLPDNERFGRMKELAGMRNQSAVLALCRLVRFERSPLLSKLAAIMLLRRPDEAPPGAERRAEAILTALKGSTRPAAKWLLTWAKFREHPEQSIATWKSLVDEELAVTDREVASEQRIQTELLRLNAELLLKLGHKDEATAVMREMVARLTDNPSPLIEFVHWLEKNDAWTVIDDVAKRYETTFNANPRLLYTLARASKTRGNEPLAEQFAQRAFDSTADRPSDANDLLADRLAIARELQLDGQLPWSEREYRAVIERGDKESTDVLSARFELAELLHDLDRDTDAAAVYQPLSDQLHRNGPLIQKLALMDPKRDPEGIRARLHYFYACAALASGDRARQQDELDKAVDADPTDADALIAFYHLPDQTAERQARARELVKQASAHFFEELGDRSVETPMNASLANEYAWLIANTEGDLDKAIDYAAKAVKQDPEAGSYCDTLARCYAAKKDFVSAVKYQERAAKLDPFSRQISRALDKYRAELAKTK